VAAAERAGFVLVQERAPTTRAAFLPENHWCVCPPPAAIPTLIPTVNGNTVRSFSSHGHQSAAKGSSTTVSRSAIRLIQPFDFSALWSDGPEVALNWLFPYPI
jgi:hypothetical protein